MKFTKYNSIENSYRQKAIDNIVTNPELMKQEWIVSEKIHGANFAIYISSNGDVKFAKRSGFIEDDEKFYSLDNCTDILEDYAVRIRDVVALPDTIITICGELFGGGYEHPSVVVPVTSCSKIQKEVSYVNHTSFMAFDLMFDDRVVDWDEAKRIFTMACVPTVPILFQGSFEEAMNIPNDGQSIVPQLFGMPALENNIMEGVVIKPNAAAFFGNGKRVILKNKNEKFSEKSKNKVKSVVTFSDEMNAAVDNMAQYINENRLSNVISHIGTIEQKDFGKVNGLFIQDVIVDYMKEYEILEDKKEWKLVSKKVNGLCAEVLRGNWLNILDGEL